APVSLWVEDFSGVRKTIEQEYNHIDDLDQYLAENPEELQEFPPFIKVLDVNDETLRLYGADDLNQIRENFPRIVAKEDVNEALRRQIVAVARNETEFEMESTNWTLDGEKINIHMKWLLPARGKEDFSRVFVAISDLTARKRYEQKLEKSLQEKETLLQEVHHRVKNNLFTVVSLLEMQRQQSEDERVSAALTEGINRIHTMALIHKNIYGTNKFDRINLAGYLKDLVEDLKSSALPEGKDIKINFQLISVELVLDKVIPAALAVNELVTNALGHAYEGKSEGQMKIKTSLEDKQLLIRVIDDGRGLPADFSIENNASLGLRLVSRLVENQLQGSFSFHSNEQTVFTCKFPV
ncbi:MAG: sensor histidine kinase, partial [bacterium]